MAIIKTQSWCYTKDEVKSHNFKNVQKVKISKMEYVTKFKVDLPNLREVTVSKLFHLLKMVIEIWFHFQICVQCADFEKAISKITFNIRWNLGKFGIRGTPEYQRVTWKGSRTMGSEWPDKHNKTGFSSVARGGEIFFSRGHPPQVNSVGSGVVWVTGLFSIWTLKLQGHSHGCGQGARSYS